MPSPPDQNLGSPKSFDLPMSPITRLGMAFGLEMSLDKKATVFTEETEKLFLERQKEAEARRDGTFKSALYIDAALAFVVAGGGFSIPIIGVNTSEIPALVPLLLIASAFAFFVASNSFITWAAYDSVNSNIAKRRCDPYCIDPEFLSASRIHAELYQKKYFVQNSTFGAKIFMNQLKFSRYFLVYCFCRLI